jgi:hypothetical protein
MSAATPFRPGQVVQVRPDSKKIWLRGSFLLVTESKSWGLIGLALVIQSSINQEPANAYIRLEFDEVAPVGQAAWIPEGTVVAPPQ